MGSKSTSLHRHLRPLNNIIVYVLEELLAHNFSRFDEQELHSCEGTYKPKLTNCCVMIFALSKNNFFNFFQLERMAGFNADKKKDLIGSIIPFYTSVTIINCRRKRDMINVSKSSHAGRRISVFCGCLIKPLEVYCSRHCVLETPLGFPWKMKRYGTFFTPIIQYVASVWFKIDERIYQYFSRNNFLRSIEPNTVSTWDCLRSNTITTQKPLLFS